MGYWAFKFFFLNFGHFTANGNIIPFFSPEILFTVNFFCGYWLKFVNFLRLTAKLFGCLTAIG